MNILLIYPEFPDTFWSFKHALKFIRKKASLPPLGLLTVAALLPPKWEKRLVDANVTQLTAEDLEWADYAFISAMTVQRDSARQIISRCKERFQYWQLLLWTLFRRPRLFPEAVTFAIYGYHFRKVCETRLVECSAEATRSRRSRRSAGVD